MVFNLRTHESIMCTGKCWFWFTLINTHVVTNTNPRASNNLSLMPSKSHVNPWQSHHYGNMLLPRVHNNYYSCYYYCGGAHPAQIQNGDPFIDFILFRALNYCKIFASCINLNIMALKNVNVNRMSTLIS